MDRAPRIFLALVLAGHCKGQTTISDAKNQFAGYITLILIILGLLAAAGLVYWLAKKAGFGANRGTVQCYLCLERVILLDWTSGTHRQECSNSSVKFDKMPRHPKETCPLCRQHLRLWPQQGLYLLDQFKCYNRQCVHGEGTLLDNTGENRYTCFTCDISFCIQCANKVAPGQPGQV